MSRKLPQHSARVVSLLKVYLPFNWIIKDLNNMHEKEVFKNFYLSKIFMSFSDLEGLGIPPIEAALFKNKVIGYTGEGGNEYWKKPIFTFVRSGDIKSFVRHVIKNLDIKNNNLSKQQKNLSKIFSKEQEEASIKKFLKNIIKL